MSRMVPHLTFCEVHEKKAFTKANAKTLIRILASPGMRQYRCGYIWDGWHVGHLPTLVRIGELSASDIYGTAA